MTSIVDTPKSLKKHYPVQFVTMASVLALAYESYRMFTLVTDLIDRLAHRASGVSFTWDPSFPAPQPSGDHFSGAPNVAQGSTAYFTEMTGTVKNLPVSTIVLQSASDMTAVLTTAGIVVCLLILMRRVANGAPFARASVRSLVALAIIVFVGFEGTTVLHSLAALGGAHIMFSSPAMPEGEFSYTSLGAELVSFWPFYIAMALLALAAVFRVGSRYEADADGLV